MYTEEQEVDSAGSKSERQRPMYVSVDEVGQELGYGWFTARLEELSAIT